jgi:hypothetical protein
MRLGQLSRKVNIKPTEILSYLKNEFDVELGSHLNTKVEDELSNKVILKFGLKPIVEPVKVVPKKTVTKITETVENNEIIEESTPVIEEKETTPEVEVTEPFVEFEAHQEVDPETIRNAELIKAPKVELAGPKVVGKIELPPTLEEQMVEVDGVMMSKAEIANRKREERKERREKSHGTKVRTPRGVRATIRKSEAQIEQIKRDKEAEHRAVKIAHRENRISKKLKVKTAPTFVPKKTKKRISTKTIEESLKTVQKPKPTTWYGKLWLWFNT